MVQEPRLEGNLHTSNTFGTWAEAVAQKLSVRSGYPVGWKMVGRDPRLMPTEHKLLELEKDSELDEVVFQEAVEENTSAS